MALDAAVQDSRSGRTARLLRHLTFRIASRALTEVYGENHSTLCLQASAAIRDILRSFGIYAELRHGAACLVKASVGGPPFTLGYAGFWDQDHHVWVETANYELVDWTISHLHRHPRTTTDDEPIPPLWWSPVNQWPAGMLYITEGTVVPGLTGDEKEKLDRLLAILPSAKASVIAEAEENRLRSDSILLGVEHMSQIASKVPWVAKAGQVENTKMEFPEWVRKRFEQIGGKKTR